MTTDEERQRFNDEIAESLKRSNKEFIEDTPGVHAPGEVAEDGKYGHPFHDRVAAYIKDSNPKLMTEFRRGFNERQQERAIEYLRGMGIISADTPTSRINEFLMAWGIAPLPDQSSEDTTIDVGPVHVGEASMPDDTDMTAEEFEGRMVSADLDDEIVDAEVIDDE